MLELINIKKKYNKQNVLKGISLKLPDKGLVSIVGESGSGKSTLLNIIGLIEKQDEGKVLINGKDTSKLKKREIDNLHKNYISFIFQQYNLVENMSVINNITINNDNNDLYSIVNMLKIRHLLTKKVNRLSGGEKQRVVIARSLMNNPRIILADEPTGALDSLNRQEVMRLLKYISSDCLVIMVTHNLSEALKYSDRIIEIKDGVVIKDSGNNKLKNRFKLIVNKDRIRFNKLLKITMSNLKGKFKRNIATSIAFSVGLLSLLVVLSISDGFRNQMNTLDKEYLSKYPIIISNNSSDLSDDLKNIFKDNKYDKNKVYSKKYEHLNIIDNNYLDYVEKYDYFLAYRMYIYDMNGLQTTYFPNKSYLNEFEILQTEKDKNDKHLSIIVDEDNCVDYYTLKTIGLEEDSYNLSDLIGYQFKLDGNNYEIGSVIKAKSDSIFSDLNGIISDYNEGIPTSIYLYPKDDVNKTKLINKLDKYNDITYTDYSDTIKSVSNTLIDGVRIVLIVFSLISLVVSTIMVGIISYINIVEHTKQIGILRSLGFSMLNIKTIFGLESISIGLVSSVICVLISLLINIPVNNLLFDLSNMNNIFLLEFKNIIIIVLLSIVLSLIGSFVSMHGISKLKIIDAIRDI